MLVKWIFLSLILTKVISIPLKNERANEDYRLQMVAKNVKYDVKLTVPDNFQTVKSFDGSVVISFEAVQRINSIRIHCDQTIYDSIKDGNTKFDVTLRGTVLQNTEITDYNADTEILVIGLGGKNEAGVYKLDFKNFKGKLYEDMHGFYLSTYKDNDDVDHYIATTQFQATYARRGFPCFDEPSYKAKFTIQLTVPDGYQVLSNQERVPETRSLTFAFEETIEMSTYLVAFIVHDFEKIDIVDPTLNTQLSIWAPGHLIDTANHAVSVTPSILKELNEFTNLPYDLTVMKQLVQVAIPDFSAGAMENWGLVTYRETALLWNENDSTNRNKQRVSTVISHEFTHMWFGNLVTMHWWSSAWLNEGLARYFEYYITNKVDPTMELSQQFVIEQLQMIMTSDSNTKALPLTSKEEDVNTPGEVSGKFGSLTYSKGGTMIRMMEHFLTQPVLQTGLKKYLNDNQKTNTKPENLFESFDNVDGIPVKDIMIKWTEQSGYPVVTATLEGNDVILTQKQFLYGENDTDAKWFIPITYATQTGVNFGETKTKLWMKPDEEIYKVTLPNENEWIIFNVQEVGYYRVQYDDILLERIESLLKSEDMISVHVLNRAQIIDDIMNLARANLVDYNVALDLSDYLVEEVDYYPWYSAFESFSFLKKRLEGNVATSLNNHIAKLMNKLYDMTTFEITDDMTHIDVLRNALALKWACELEMGDCVDKAKELFEAQSAQPPQAINPNLRSVVYCNALRFGTEDDWNKLYEKLGLTFDANERGTIISALGCTRDTEILQKYLDMSVDNSIIRKQDAYSVFTAVLTGNPEGVDIAFKFLQNNYTEIRENYGSMNALSNVITSVADRLTTSEQVDELKEFVEREGPNLEDAVTVAEAAIATAEANIAWAQDNSDELLDWLSPPSKPGSSSGLNVPIMLIALLISFLKFF